MVPRITPGLLYAVAALNGLMGVMMAATGAHWLPADLDAKSRAFFLQAADMQLLHALAMTGGAIHYRVSKQVWSCRGVAFFQLGIIGFSLSLYWRAFMGEGSLGVFHWITPVGGLMFMLGWFSFVIAGFKEARESK